MTDKKDFKQLVRERTTRTGESYTTARVRILAQTNRESTSVSSARVGESIDDGSLCAAPAMDAIYLKRVADLGVEQIRYRATSNDEFDAVYFLVSKDFAYDREKELIQRLRELWADERHELVVVRRTLGGSRILWSRDSEELDSRWEKEHYGVRLIHEHSGRWAARANDGSVEYGLSAADAQAKLLEQLATADCTWENAVDDETRAYIESQDD